MAEASRAITWPETLFPSLVRTVTGDPATVGAAAASESDFFAIVFDRGGVLLRFCAAAAGDAHRQNIKRMRIDFIAYFHQTRLPRLANPQKRPGPRIPVLAF